MTSLRPRPRVRWRDDEGVALIVSIALIGLVGVLMLTILVYALGETRASGRDRQRASSVTAAEGQLDVTLAQIQNSSTALLPCGPQPGVASQQSAADVIDIVVDVTYYDAAGDPVACGLLTSGVATEAKVVSTGTSQPLAGQAPAQRKIETLVRLTPTFQTGLQQAIFGNAGVSLQGNGQVFGEDGKPNADVYTNGDFTCAQGSNQVYQGSVYAQGTARFSGSCVVQVDVHAAVGVLSDGPKLAVGGRVLVSGGNAALAAGHTVGQQVRASGTISWTGCSTSANKCVPGQVVAPPPAYDFPQINWNPTTQAEWALGGYTNIVDDQDDCTSTNTTNNQPTQWLLDNADDPTRGPTVLVTPCRLELSKNAGTIELADDLVIFARGGITFERSLTIRSNSAEQRRIYFIQPYDAGTPGCDIGIKLDNRVTIESTVDDLLYTPCNVVKANNSDHYGQIYAGGTATIANNLTLFYKPLPVFGVPPNTEIVQYYELDTLYKRELQN